MTTNTMVAFLKSDMESGTWMLIGLVLTLTAWVLGRSSRLIRERQVGIVVKRMASKSLLPGRLIALEGEAGFQADTLAPGLHFGYWPWQYRIIKVPVTVVPQGEIALVLAAAGEAIPPQRILGKVVDCHNFQDARKFLVNGGEKGRQIGILTAGTYRINTAQFTVITAATAHEHGMSPQQLQLQRIEPDKVGIVTTLDGRPIEAGEIAGSAIPGHDNFQNAQAFLDGCGRRGLQEQILLSGTWNLNPWFAQVEQVAMAHIPIGCVGVVISFVGAAHVDVSGPFSANSVADGCACNWSLGSVALKDVMRFFAAVLLLSCLGVSSPARADWPDFRGPWRNGRAAAPGDTNQAGLPLHWSDTENVKWKTAIPYRGWSTPVILNGQIWLTTATVEGHDFFAVCVDESSGKIVFNERIFHCDNPESLGAATDFNCYASPSAVVEPGRVYVNFGSYGTACLDTSSFKILWKRDDLPCRHFRGPGSSPIVWSNLLILTLDGIDLQYVAGLDKNTGKTIWKTDRTADWNDLGANGQPTGGGDYRKAFSTPIVIDAGGAPQMLSVGSRAAYGYDPVTGREIWKIATTAFSPASRPIFDRGLAIFATGNGKSEVLALRPNGHGEVPGSAAVWRATRAAPSQCSGTVDNGLLFMVNEGGIASCFQSADGAEVWRERIGGQYSASVLYGDGRIYCLSREGKITVLRAGRTFESLATNELPNGFMASPAVSGHALYLRTRTDLYRIEDATAPGTKSGL